ncbi:Purine nucleoside phosphorylase [Dissulfuribacter thermophilus]|uniref:Purine nucleoside phosphorylase n=1 Tax=Dissulfuribacter thermophilus TaxID=1156395 RepID=A0A1B9F3A6_9BACT|nr:purine-nucleoside phosphorylase [Dissulfuribacter thermophilus]OCC14400.1 Purine nucleoside phosphorylase [Dissulfuribacter thermophilus]
MDKYIEKIEETRSFFEERLSSPPEAVVMLGTGLGGVSKALMGSTSFPYEEIPNFPVSTSPEHRGVLHIGEIHGHTVALFEGRFHFYEGYSTRELTLPLRVMALLGTKVLIASNAAGGLDLSYSPGDLMLIKDHINLIPDNPLRGPNVDSWGERFPDMSKAYSKRLRDLAKKVGKDLGIPIREGVFVAVPGPSLETPSETRFLRIIGADAVAMSLVPEVIVAVHAGMEVLGISVIANVNNPDAFEPIRIEDVIEGARRAEEALTRLVLEIFKRGILEKS